MANEVNGENVQAVMDKHFKMAGIEEDDGNSVPVEGGQDTLHGESPVQNDTTPGSNTDAGSGQDSIQGEGQDKLPSGQGDGSDDKTKQQQETQGKEAKPTGPGDLKLPDGTVVKGGMERRWYESWQHEQRSRAHIQNELNRQKQQYDTVQTKYQELSRAMEQLGLEDANAVSSAIRLYKDLQTRPVQAVQQLLVDLKAAGYNLEGIGQGVDTQAIQRMLDQRLGSQTQDSVKGDGKDSDVIAREAALETANFFNSFPDAVIHEPFLAAVIEANPEADLFSAYDALKRSAIQQGFDWSQPLAPQIEARKANPGGQQQQQPVQNKQNPGPAPVDGRGGVGNAHAAEHDPNKIPLQANTFEDAIKAGMREAGLNIQ